MSTTRQKIVNLIRKELQDSTLIIDWEMVEYLCKAAKLNDTAFRDKLLKKDKRGVLKDFLLSPSYHKKQTK
uniref:Uncharacterized protein n=1 Tax=viral metagenome TaxID=1070528 RepID=A0A6H1ZNG6_9ZZZZ